MLFVAVATMAQPADKMAKYYKRTGQKFLDEKAKVDMAVALFFKTLATTLLSMLTISNTCLVRRKRAFTNCLRACFTEF